MRTVIAASTHTLVSLPNEELLALANCLNEVLHNSTIDAANSGTRLGVSIDTLQKLHAEISESLSRPREESEQFHLWRDQASLQLRAITSYGDPADLGFDELRGRLEELEHGP